MPSGAQAQAPEAPVFVSEHPYRRVFVRSAVGVVAVFFAAWLIALVTGISGFGGLPGLEVKPDPGSGSGEAAEAPASAGERAAAAEAAAAGTAAGQEAPRDGGAEPSRPTESGGGGAVAPTPTAPTTPGDGSSGTPDVTPGGNVPGANANGGAGGSGQGYGGGVGGGRTKSG